MVQSGRKIFLIVIVGRKVSNPLIFRRPPRLFTSPLFSIFPCHYLQFLLSCFFAWLCHLATSNKFCLMILRLKVVESWYQQHLDKCFMQQAVKFTERFGTYDMGFASILIWYHTHTNKHREDTKAPTNRSKSKYILTPPDMYKQKPPVLQWITCWYKNLLYRDKQYICFSKVVHL